MKSLLFTLLPMPLWLQDGWRAILVALLTVCALVLPATRSFAAAPAGTQIGNQASATYSDSSAVTRTVTSNTVVTTIQQVASISITADSAKTISAGGQVYYPHTIVNTGNGTDTLTLSSSATGTVSFSSVLFYADVNGDGIPDNNTAITSTGQLAAGQMFKFVAAGVVPPTAVSGNTNALTITATSGFNTGVHPTVVDTTTVTGQAVISVTQAIDVTQGASPAGPRTVTITYTNTGNTTATNLTLAEVIPSGMTYEAASARWSVTGNGTTLTDASNSDNQSGIVYDYGVTTGTRVTAVIASIAPGTSGTLSFRVNINGSLPAGANAATAATATFTYYDGAATIPSANANTLQYTVLPTAGVNLVGSAAVSTAVQGAAVSFTNTVTNTGNGSDSFDLSTSSSLFPTGTTFQWFQADGVTPLVDSNNNGLPDTGPLAAGAAVNVVLRATLPAGTTGTGYTVVSTATSKLDTSKTASVTNTLSAVTGNSIDLTNDNATGSAPGHGAGPEGSSVKPVSVNPGAIASFTLVVANGSSVADSFNLQASTDVNFATNVLPSGWHVVFKDSNGALVDGTGVVNSLANKVITAEISVPASTLPGTTQIYFRAISPNTGAADRLHNSVTVNTLRSLVIAPNNVGQLTAGGTTVYTHILTNTGNLLEGDGSASITTLAVANSGSGFTSLVYWDINNNGVLDPADPVVTNLSALTGGSNGASTGAGLDPGENVRLFVKVTAPAGAAIGAFDAATLTVTTTGTVGGISAPAAVVTTDSSSVITSQITLVKTQALDANCDGTADTAFSMNTILAGASPGACVRYEVTATNGGPVAVASLVISDATPAYTTYHAVAAASVTAGSVTTVPAGAATGAIQATVGTLAPGQSVVLRFGVRIEP